MASLMNMPVTCLPCQRVARAPVMATRARRGKAIMARVDDTGPLPIFQGLEDREAQAKRDGW